MFSSMTPVQRLIFTTCVAPVSGLGLSFFYLWASYSWRVYRGQPPPVWSRSYVRDVVWWATVLSGWCISWALNDVAAVNRIARQLETIHPNPGPRGKRTRVDKTLALPETRSGARFGVRDDVAEQQNDVEEEEIVVEKEHRRPRAQQMSQHAVNRLGAKQQAYFAQSVENHCNAARRVALRNGVSGKQKVEFSRPQEAWLFVNPQEVQRIQQEHPRLEVPVSDTRRSKENLSRKSKALRARNVSCVASRPVFGNFGRWFINSDLRMIEPERKNGTLRQAALQIRRAVKKQKKDATNADVESKMVDFARLIQAPEGTPQEYLAYFRIPRNDMRVVEVTPLAVAVASDLVHGSVPRISMQEQDRLLKEQRQEEERRRFLKEQSEKQKRLESQVKLASHTTALRGESIVKLKLALRGGGNAMSNGCPEEDDQSITSSLIRRLETVKQVVSPTSEPVSVSVSHTYPNCLTGTKVVSPEKVKLDALLLGRECQSDDNSRLVRLYFDSSDRRMMRPLDVSPGFCELTVEIRFGAPFDFDQTASSVAGTPTVDLRTIAHQTNVPEVERTLAVHARVDFIRKSFNVLRPYETSFVYGCVNLSALRDLIRPASVHATLSTVYEEMKDRAVKMSSYNLDISSQGFEVMCWIAACFSMPQVTLNVQPSDGFQSMGITLTKSVMSYVDRIRRWCSESNKPTVKKENGPLLLLWKNGPYSMVFGQPTTGQTGVMPRTSFTERGIDLVANCLKAMRSTFSGLAHTLTTLFDKSSEAWTWMRTSLSQAGANIRASLASFVNGWRGWSVRRVVSQARNLVVTHLSKLSHTASRSFRELSIRILMKPKGFLGHFSASLMKCCLSIGALLSTSLSTLGVAYYMTCLVMNAFISPISQAWNVTIERNLRKWARSAFSTSWEDASPIVTFVPSCLLCCLDTIGIACQGLSSAWMRLLCLVPCGHPASTACSICSYRASLHLIQNTQAKAAADSLDDSASSEEYLRGMMAYSRVAAASQTLGEQQDDSAFGLRQFHIQHIELRPSAESCAPELTC